MEIEIEIQKARYIEVDAQVRYWEDAVLNGEADEQGKMPFRKNDMWKPVIELATGQILNWPSGVTADIHYKVCDAGLYWLLDENKNRILKWKGYYVPNNILCTKRNGYGDYIIFAVQEDGIIKNWRQPDLDEKEWVEDN